MFDTIGYLDIHAGARGSWGKGRGTKVADFGCSLPSLRKKINKKTYLFLIMPDIILKL